MTRIAKTTEKQISLDTFLKMDLLKQLLWLFTQCNIHYWHLSEIHRQLEAELKQSSTMLSGIELVPYLKDQSESSDRAL